MTDKNIVLCGFMGSGKSTVGKYLSKLTGRAYIDMDIYIEQQQGMKVKNIFEQYGEDYFRYLEHEASVKLAQEKNLIIAAGGGTLLFERNSMPLSSSGIIVLLDVALGTIKYRLRNDTKRPLLQRPDKFEAMTKLYNERIPIYRQVANVTIKTRKSPRLVAQAVLTRIEAYEKENL